MRGLRGSGRREPAGSRGIGAGDPKHRFRGFWRPSVEKRSARDLSCWGDSPRGTAWGARRGPGAREGGKREGNSLAAKRAPCERSPCVCVCVCVCARARVCVCLCVCLISSVCRCRAQRDAGEKEEEARGELSLILRRLQVGPRRAAGCGRPGRGRRPAGAHTLRPPASHHASGFESAAGGW